MSSQAIGTGSPRPILQVSEEQHSLPTGLQREVEICDSCERVSRKQQATSPSGTIIPSEVRLNAAETLRLNTLAPVQSKSLQGAQPFKINMETVADVQILRYPVPGFRELSLQQKTLAYYLYQAALSGRDITYDQKYKHNLAVRRTLEAIVNNPATDRKGSEFQKFMEFTKRVWISNGIHHHSSYRKILPEFSPASFASWVRQVSPAELPLQEGEDVEALIAKLSPILFDPTIAPTIVDKSEGADLVADSANNFYEGLTQAEVEAYYASRIDPSDPTPISYGLNSKLIKEQGRIVEKTWKVGGMYGAALERVVFWLERAATVAENEQQKEVIEKLVKYYKSGNLEDFDEYNKAWVRDTESRVDFINGFIEVYGDAMGYRGSFESVVSIKDLEASERIKTVGNNAQWFEDHSPIDPKHKKPTVVGIEAKVISAVVEAGDAAPTTPIGINLPNSNWIREQHGSKSVSLGNIMKAYEDAGGSEILEEFAFTPAEIARSKKYGGLASLLKVDMHEVIGHASGRINDGVGTPKETLKSYASTLEEARADLVALYYLLDPKLVELGLMPSLDVGRAGYDGYMRNGLMTQLRRVPLGEKLEESHMQNRQLIASWAYEKGRAEKVIEKVSKEGKTYFAIRDYGKLRTLLGQLLREIQRIKSEGDYEAGKALVEGYGVQVDRALHEEVLQRMEGKTVAPYHAFIQPKLVPVMKQGKISDVRLEQPTDFTQQMLRYSKEYSLLPTYN